MVIEEAAGGVTVGRQQQPRGPGREMCEEGALAPRTAGMQGQRSGLA